MFLITNDIIPIINETINNTGPRISLNITKNNANIIKNLTTEVILINFETFPTRNKDTNKIKIVENIY